MRTLLLSMLAVISAVVMPLAASSQIAPEKPASTTIEPENKYEVFAGVGYTSLNQVNQSRNGLLGGEATVTRNWGKYFGLTALGGHYAYTISSSNVGNPTVDMFLVGPSIHASLVGRVGIFVRGELGVVHTGGVTISPSESFAGGVGLGMDYSLSPHFALRAAGDDIGSSFTVVPFEPGDSPHVRFNAHAAFGVVYKF